MKLTKYIQQVLNNYATINAGIVLLPGENQKQINQDKSVVAEFVFDFGLTEPFGIYDLPLFLANVTALSEPEIEFVDKYALIKSDNVQVKFISCRPDLAHKHYDLFSKKLVMTSPDVVFDFPKQVFQRMIKLASLNDLPHVAIVGRADGKVVLQGLDPHNETTNGVVVEVSEYNGEPFRKDLKLETLKIIPDDYAVEVKLAGMTKFTSKNNPHHYFIGLVKS